VFGSSDVGFYKIIAPGVVCFDFILLRFGLIFCWNWCMLYSSIGSKECEKCEFPVSKGHSC
jgi:hypothetical protein